MTIVYDKLWHRLAEKGLRKKDLREAAGISRASIAKLGKNEIVTTEVLAKICTALSCDISEIAEVSDTLAADCTPIHMDAHQRFRVIRFLRELVDLISPLSSMALRQSIYVKSINSAMKSLHPTGQTCQGQQTSAK